MAPFWVDCPSHNRMLEYRNSWPTSRAATLLWYCRSAATLYSKASYSLEPHLAESRMKETTVSVTKFGAVPIRSFASALAALNIHTGEDSEFAVVLTDDIEEVGGLRFQVTE